MIFLHQGSLCTAPVMNQFFLTIITFSLETMACRKHHIRTSGLRAPEVHGDLVVFEAHPAQQISVHVYFSFGRVGVCIRIYRVVHVKFSASFCKYPTISIFFKRSSSRDVSAQNVLLCFNVQMHVFLVMFCLCVSLWLVVYSGVCSTALFRHH